MIQEIGSRRTVLVVLFVLVGCLLGLCFVVIVDDKFGISSSPASWMTSTTTKKVVDYQQHHDTTTVKTTFSRMNSSSLSSSAAIKNNWSSSSSSSNHNHHYFDRNDNGGCGYVTTTTPVQWYPFTKQQKDQFTFYQDCLIRIYDGLPIRPQLLNSTKLRYLHCPPITTATPRGRSSSADHLLYRSNISYQQQYYKDDDEDDNNNNDLNDENNDRGSMMIIRRLIRQYQTIHFIGDSILNQQYYALICMLEPNITNHHIVVQRNSDGTIMDLEYNYSATTTTTTPTSSSQVVVQLRYSKFGYKFDPNEDVLYKNQFIHAIQTLSQQDAIIVNAGSHYEGQYAHKMQKVLEFIRSQSKVSKTNIYYMEPTTEEWYPTSNGFYQRSCHVQCKTCRAITTRTMWGYDNFTNPDDNEINIVVNDTTTNINKKNLIVHGPGESTFLMLYGESIWSKLISITLKQGCLQNCGPNRWRIDLVRYIFFGMLPPPPPLSALSLSMNHSHHYHHSIQQQSGYHSLEEHRVRVVPIWWQLVALRMPTSVRRIGDCTHKSTHALWMMNQQLIRTMSLYMVH